MRARGMERRRAFTLLELLIAGAIIAALAAMLVPISKRVKQRAEQAKCMSHMRTIHSALTGHISDKGQWPQLPDDEEKDWSEDEFFEFWVIALEPYGTSEDTWLCPSDKVYLQQRKKGAKDQYFGSYVPTPFDKNPGTPFRWNQPWLLERGDFHGKGAHMLMPDGSVQESQNPFYGR